MTPAARLASAEAEFIEAEHAVEALLDALYDKWSSFEACTDEISVFGVTPSPAAVTALYRAGWRVVHEHDHRAEKFIACACRRSKSP
jgi:hypothetical protein